jgi:hypothetical protein
MTLIRTEEAMPGLSDTTTTAAKRIGRWLDQVDWENLGRRKRMDTLIPGLDAARLSRKYGMEAASAPQPIEATFTVPLGVTRTRYLEYRKRALKRMIEGLDKMGWEFIPKLGIEVTKGMYPAVDLRDRKPDFDKREMRIKAFFRFRKPEPVKIELPKELVEDRVVKA